MKLSPAFYPHLSVDCVLLGFDGEDLKVLLVERTDTMHSQNFNDMKLPGRLIYEHEDLDDAAHDVLKDLTGIDHSYLKQFKTFGSPSRTSNPRDVKWLENAVKLKIGRLVTVAYLSFIRITHCLNVPSPDYKAYWHPVCELPDLAFDHNDIINEAHAELQRYVELDPAILFELLPAKFTATELRKLFEKIYNKKLDVRNFHKKIESMPYVVRLDEWQKKVPHRAARYYRFDKKKLK